MDYIIKLSIEVLIIYLSSLHHLLSDEASNVIFGVSECYLLEEDAADLLLGSPYNRIAKQNIAWDAFLSQVSAPFYFCRFPMPHRTFVSISLSSIT